MFHRVENSSFKGPKQTDIYRMCKIESRPVIQEGIEQVIRGTQDEAWFKSCVNNLEEKRAANGNSGDNRLSLLE